MEDYNPFTDPAILETQSGGRTVAAGNTNPSAASYSAYVVGNNEPTAGQYTLPSQNQSGGSSASKMGAPPPYSASAKPINNEELLKQQEILERKAAELEQKEREIKQREVAAGIRPNNFPPLPSFIPFQPCYYQDFDVDIAQEFRATVKSIYYIYLAFVAVLLLNVISCFAYAFSGEDNSISMVVFGVLYLVLGTPCAYACWMRAVYNAFKKDSSFSFFLFFFTFFLKIVIIIFFAIGATGYGACGWLVTLKLFSDEHYVSAVFCLVTALGFTLLSIAMSLMLQKVHTHYRRSDASFEKAQAEFSSGVMTNKHVQSAAVNVAKTAATSAASTANNP